MTTPAPLESAVARTVVWLAISLIPIPLLLTIDPGDRLVAVSVHLSVIVTAGIALTVALAPTADALWFEWTDLRAVNRTRSGAALLVAMVTGYSALVTLASSAALRFDASLQFLQLLSALDIAWAAAALYLGVRWMAGPRPALAAAALLGAFCVGSIWNYLRIVGFDADGGWLVDRSALTRYVLPFDMAAAIAALIAFWLGSRKSAARLHR